MERSRPALIALIALSWAGCFSDRGIAIEVDVGQTGATSVELYVGNSLCSDHKDAPIRCDGGIAPPMVSAHLAGTVWFRDDPVPYRARVIDRKATFRLEAGADTPLPIVIAVGSGGDPATPVGTATLTDVVVPARSARVLTTKLVAAGAVQPSSATSEDRVQVWNQPAGSSCVVVEHWADGKATRDFIVPGDDPDCDSVAKECDPAAANGSLLKNGVDKAPECFADSPDAAGACQLGALGCVDGGDANGMCFTTRDVVCVPKAFCECHGRQPDGSCTGPKLGGNMDGLPHVTCTVRISDLGVCRDQSDVLDLNHHLGSNGCKQPTLSAIDLSTLAARGRSHNFAGVDLELTSPDNDCGFRVQANSGIPATDVPQLGVIRLVADQHAVMLPIIFLFKRVGPACLPVEDTMSCEVNLADTQPGDPMWTCVP